MRERAGNDRCVAGSSQECRVRRGRDGPGTSRAAAVAAAVAVAEVAVCRVCAGAQPPSGSNVYAFPIPRRCRALRHLSAAGPNRPGPDAPPRGELSAPITTVFMHFLDFRDFDLFFSDLRMMRDGGEHLPPAILVYRYCILYLCYENNL